MTAFSLLLQEALKPIKAAGHEVVQYNLNVMNIKPCQDCGGCTKTGVCVVNDAMKEIYETMETTTDRGEDVANLLEEIVLKRS